jgi:hypothetical protein
VPHIAFKFITVVYIPLVAIRMQLTTQRPWWGERISVPFCLGMQRVGLQRVIVSRTGWLTMVQRKGIGLFAFDARRVGTVRLLRREAGIILAVGEVGDDGS